MNVAFFDLDGTLLDGDTDVLWGQVLSEHGVFDPETTAAFQSGYSSGNLDAEDFVARFLSPLSEHGEEACQPWLRELLEDHVFPSLRAEALERLEWHRQSGHELVLATATNEYLTSPIAEHLQIPHLLASPAEKIHDRYTGQPAGPACFRAEKLRYATDWLGRRGLEWGQVTSWFYSDSIHDLPLLEAVQNAVAVAPDEDLLSLATDRGWEILAKQPTG
jgi:HAD superfamily hydrolase (TIGR01490 family)